MSKYIVHMGSRKFWCLRQRLISFAQFLRFIAISITKYRKTVSFLQSYTSKFLHLLHCHRQFLSEKCKNRPLSSAPFTGISNWKIYQYKAPHRLKPFNWYPLAEVVFRRGGADDHMPPPMWCRGPNQVLPHPNILWTFYQKVVDFVWNWVKNLIYLNIL